MGCVRSKDRGDNIYTKTSKPTYRPIPYEGDPNIPNEVNGKKEGKYQPLTSSNDSVEKTPNDANAKKGDGYQLLISQHEEQEEENISCDPAGNDKTQDKNQPQISHDSVENGNAEGNKNVPKDRPLTPDSQDTGESGDNQLKDKNCNEKQLPNGGDVEVLSHDTVERGHSEINVKNEANLISLNNNSVEFIKSDANENYSKHEGEKRTHISPNDNHVEEKDLAFEKARAVINTSMQYLKNCDDYTSDNAWLSIKQLSVASCIISSIGIESRLLLASHLVKEGFAQLFVKIIRSLQADNTSSCGPHREDSFKDIKGTCTNFSTGHEFEVLVCELMHQGAVDLLLKELDDSFPAAADNEVIRVVHTLNILSNCVRCPDTFVRSTYRSANAVTVLMKYLKSDEIKLKMESLSILAYIVNDKEGDILASAEDCIAHLVDMLKQAVAADDYYVHYSIAGEPCGDGVYGLIDTMNRLAVNDSSKREIMQHESIPAIIQILQIEGAEAMDSQLAALETLWKIAFLDNHRQVLIKHIQDTFVFKILTNMQTSPDPALRDASTGLLWKLGLMDIHPDDTKSGMQANDTLSDDSESEGQEQILLSYNKDNIEQVTKVKERLLAGGFEVWMDSDKVDGNFLIPMEAAVRSSAVVMLCGSLKYKESVYCQTEATYANELKKPIIGVVVEENYEVDGWLAALVNTQKQFQAFSDNVLEQDIDELIETMWMCLIET